MSEDGRVALNLYGLAEKRKQCRGVLGLHGRSDGLRGLGDGSKRR